MWDSILNFLQDTGIAQLFENSDWWKTAIMFAIAFVLVYLAIVKKFEPLLLLPIAIGMLLTNLPGAGMFHLNFFITPEETIGLVEEFTNEDSEDEGVFPLEADAADLEEIVRTVFVLNLDSKLLCKPDCKGLCCRCGKNLNDGPCGCQKELDPRFAALQQLLNK